MPVEITWIGHASFRLSGEGGVVYIDPWKIPAGLSGDGNVVIVSHDHYDHCSPDDVAKVSMPGATVVVPPGMGEQFPDASPVGAGEKTTVGGITVEAVPAYNVGKKFHPRDNGWIGAVVTLDNMRIYYAGDTDLIDEMSDLEAIEVALLPVGGTYTMTAGQAAEACERIGCKVAIPYHWGDIVGTADDAEAFAEAVSCCVVKVVQPGRVISV